MRKTEAVSYLRGLARKPAHVRSLLSDICILEKHEKHSIESAQKYRDDVASTSSGEIFLISVDFKSNTEVPKWRGDVFDSYAPTVVGIFGIRVDYKGSKTFIDAVTVPVAHSAETALFLLSSGLVKYFQEKNLNKISVNKVSIWADCARHFRCGAFVQGALSILEGSYFLSEERTVRNVTVRVCCDFWPMSWGPAGQTEG